MHLHLGESSDENDETTPDVLVVTAMEDAIAEFVEDFHGNKSKDDKIHVVQGGLIDGQNPFATMVQSRGIGH